MKIQVDVFKSEEDMKHHSPSWHTFSMGSKAPYPSPAVSDEFKKELVDKARNEIFGKIHAEDSSQSVMSDDSTQDTMPENCSCTTSEWDCRKDSFTVQLKFPKRHAVLNYNKDDSVLLIDFSKPDWIFYLKGVIEH